jgi:outer membrane immunogenic protein
VLVTPATLLYAKGGVAFFDGQARQTTTKPGYITTGTDPFTGWTAGAGVEQRLTDHISIRLEYAHFDFGTQVGMQTSISDPPIGWHYHNWTSLNADTLKLGAAYKF